MQHIITGAFTTKKGKTGNYHLSHGIPEPALRSIFTDLVNACLLLDRGDSTADGVEVNWTPIVHRDISLDNVWLVDRLENHEFPSYPRAVLGDFGLAVRTNKDDPLNPTAYNDSDGKDVWLAPEQHIFVRDGTNRLVRHPYLSDSTLGEHTNVWGIGAVMVRLMNSNLETPDNWGRCTLMGGQPEVPRVNELVPYSDELIDAVNTCVHFDPKERYDLEDLKETILLSTTAGTALTDRAEGLRTNRIGANDGRLRLRYPQDRYKIAFAREE